MLSHSPDVPTALKLLGLSSVPENFEILASKVAWTHPAAEAMSDVQSLAYRVVWEAVEERINSRTAADFSLVRGSSPGAGGWSHHQQPSHSPGR
jgi:hypothetical protein